MNYTRALIVGIDAYDYPEWDVDGPVKAALEMVRWLISLKGTIALRIDLFISQRAPLTAAAQKEFQNDATIQWHGKADWVTLDNFVRTQLAKNCPADSNLIVFWSGHGFTSTTYNDRLFYCSDYSPKTLNRVFNASNLLRMLRTQDYRCFSNQILLADVCGVYEINFSDTSELHQQMETNQLAYFATPEGRYANSFTAGGIFTETALNVLGSLGEQWSDHNALIREMNRAFDKIGDTPFRISGRHNNQDLRESIVGRTPSSVTNTLFLSVHSMLSNLDMSECDFRPHYLRTVADLGVPELVRAQGLVGALQELSSLRDTNFNHPVPHGLMQFLMRLERETAIGLTITKWLDREAGSQANSRREIAKKLAEEKMQKVLMIEVQVDRQGREVVSFKPYLCQANGSFVHGEEFDLQTVRNWSELTAGLQALFTRFTRDGTFHNLQLHFLVDPPLFDRPFLDIPIMPDGLPIGIETVVVLRHRQRMFSSDIGIRKKWIEYAEALRAVRPTELQWLPIDRNNAMLPLEEGLCYAAFSLPHPEIGAISCKDEKVQLYKLLRLGTPCIYLPHVLPNNTDWQTIKEGLASLTGKLLRIDAFGDSFRDARTRGIPLASNATLLWDDPLSNPFVSTRGANDE